MPSSRTPYDKGDKGKEGGRPDIKDRFVTLFRGLSKSKARRYTIEVKDAKSGAVVMFAAVDWSKTQKRAGMAKQRAFRMTRTSQDLESVSRRKTPRPPAFFACYWLRNMPKRARARPGLPDR